MQSKSMISSGIKIPMIQCVRGEDHEGESITSICLQCDYCICCAVCIKNDHPGHKTESIRVRLRSIRDLNLAVKEDIGKSILLDSVSTIYQQLKQSIQTCRTNVLQELAEIQQLVEKQFDHVISGVADLSDLDSIDSQMPSVKSAKELQSIVDKIKMASMLSEVHGTNPIGSFTQSLTKTKNSLVVLVENVLKQFTGNTKEIKSAVSMLHKVKSSKAVKLCDNGRKLIQTSKLPAIYVRGIYVCNKCRISAVASSKGPVWHCDCCNYDLCPSCSQE